MCVKEERAVKFSLVKEETPVAFLSRSPRTCPEAKNERIYVGGGELAFKSQNERDFKEVHVKRKSRLRVRKVWQKACLLSTKKTPNCPGKFTVTIASAMSRGAPGCAGLCL